LSTTRSARRTICGGSQQCGLLGQSRSAMAQVGAPAIPASVRPALIQVADLRAVSQPAPAGNTHANPNALGPTRLASPLLASRVTSQRHEHCLMVLLDLDEVQCPHSQLAASRRGRHQLGAQEASRGTGHCT